MVHQTFTERTDVGGVASEPRRRLLIERSLVMGDPSPAPVRRASSSGATAAPLPVPRSLAPLVPRHQGVRDGLAQGGAPALSSRPAFLRPLGAGSAH